MSLSVIWTIALACGRERESRRMDACADKWKNIYHQLNSAENKLAWVTSETKLEKEATWSKGHFWHSIKIFLLELSVHLTGGSWEPFCLGQAITRSQRTTRCRLFSSLSNLVSLWWMNEIDRSWSEVVVVVVCQCLLVFLVDLAWLVVWLLLEWSFEWHA